MTRALAKLVRFGLAFGLPFGVAPVGCAYDWSAPAFDAGAADAPSDGSAGPAPDASGDSATTLDATGDGVANADAADCATLLNELAAEKPPAKACSLPDPNACTNELTDECGCSVVVGNAGATAVNTYAATLQRFRGSCPRPASCPPGCASAQKGLCVADAPDAGTLHCSQ